MSIKKIFKDGMAEHKRKSSLRSSKRDLAEKEKAYEVKLTALGKKARDAKLDISQFGDLSGTLSQIEGKGKEIGAKLDELNKQTAGLEGKKKAENARFDALWKDLETKKKPVDSELKSEKGKLEKAQKEADSIQKRLKDIPDEEEKIGKKITESQGNAQAQNELEKKLTALKEEQKQLDPKLPDLTRFIQAAKEKITPLAEQSHRLEGEIKKAKDHHKADIDEIDRALSKAKSEIGEWDKKQKEALLQQDQNCQALGKQLVEANFMDSAIASELDAVKASEKEIASIRAGIQSLEGQKAPGARGAVWKMAGLILVFLIVIAGIVIGAILISKSTTEKKADKGRTEAKTTLVDRGESLKRKVQDAGQDIPTIVLSQNKRELTQQEFEQVTEKLTKILQALEDELNEIPRDTFDPQMIVDKVGKDPEQLFQWVRDNTQLVSYQGSLRGPIGVLMDRMGNSFDRSRLLAMLLEIAGHEVRLAHAVLTEQEAMDLQEKLRSIPESPTRFADEGKKDSPSHLERLAQQLEIEAAKLQQELDSAEKAEDQENQNAMKSADEQATMLADLVGKHFVQDRSDMGSSLKALRDHWWVQVKSGELWQDLDPNLPSAKLGSLITKAKDTTGLKNISDDNFHSVKIRIGVEQWADGHIKENVVLEHTVKPPEFFGRRIALKHVSMNWPRDLNLSGDRDPMNRLKAEVLKEKEWLPFLTIGSDLIYQSSFTQSGDVNKSSQEKSQGGSVGGLSQGFFGALAGRESEEEVRKTSYLTAEWIEYEIHTPGEPSRTIRRYIFDLIGPAVRSADLRAAPEIDEAGRLKRGLTLYGTIDILPLVCRLSSEFVSWEMTSHLLERLRPLIEELKKGGPGHLQEVAGNILTEMHSLQGPLYSWALKRHLLGRFHNDIFLASLNICNLRRQFIENEKGNLQKRHTFDIVKNDIGLKSRAEGEAALARLNQGVADTVAEALVMFGSESHENTSHLVSLSSEQGVNWKIMRKPQDFEGREWPADVSARIQQNLAAGDIIAFPEKALLVKEKKRLGWWRVNPASGDTVGVMDTGLNQGVTENRVVNEINDWRVAQTEQTVFVDDPEVLRAMGLEELAEYMGFQGVNGTVKEIYIALIRSLL